MGRLLDADGVELPSVAESRTGIPDWVGGPIEGWSLGMVLLDEARPGSPDRFYLGDPPLRVWVLLEGDWRRSMTVEDLIGVAGGSYEAIAKRKCERRVAELIARAWLKIAGDWRAQERVEAQTLSQAIRTTVH